MKNPDGTRVPYRGERAFVVDLARKVREARLEAGLSQTQAAAALSTTQSAISLYEAGARSISIKLLLDLCSLYHKTLDYFLGKDLKYVVVGSKLEEVLDRFEKDPDLVPQVIEYMDFLGYDRENRLGREVGKALNWTSG